MWGKKFRLLFRFAATEWFNIFSLNPKHGHAKRSIFAMFYGFFFLFSYLGLLTVLWYCIDMLLMGLFSEILTQAQQQEAETLMLVWHLIIPLSRSLFFLFQYLFQVKNNAPSAHNPDDPFNDEERERLQVEALAKKFENKYVSYYLLITAFFSKCFLSDHVKITVWVILEFWGQYQYCYFIDS